jgi:hypothetical protein
MHAAAEGGGRVAAPLLEGSGKSVAACESDGHGDANDGVLRPRKQHHGLPQSRL